MSCSVSTEVMCSPVCTLPSLDAVCSVLEASTALVHLCECELSNTAQLELLLDLHRTGLTGRL